MLLLHGSIRSCYCYCYMVHFGLLLLHGSIQSPERLVKEPDASHGIVTSRFYDASDQL
jgi:hypothetical protein